MSADERCDDMLAAVGAPSMSEQARSPRVSCASWRSLLSLPRLWGRATARWRGPICSVVGRSCNANGNTCATV